MKKLHLILLISLFIATGCGMDQLKTDQDKIAEELNPVRNKDETIDPDLDKRLGYVNYTREQFDTEPKEEGIVTMDRNKMADTITRIILQNKGFDEVATLVTDQEVLIAYDKNNHLSDDEALDFAQKSAISVMPRFFEVYVTDNPSLIPDIQSLHNTTTLDRSHNNTLQQIISEMKKHTPQENQTD